MDTVVDFVTNLNNEQNSVQYFTWTTSFSTTVNDISHDVETYLSNRCVALSDAQLTIDVRNITINVCRGAPGEPIVLNFVNTGQARANCIIDVVMNTAVTAMANINNV